MASGKKIKLIQESLGSIRSILLESNQKIYVNQKKFNKAIKAYEILSLKYPKKSSFFADQIIYIKKLKSKD